MEVQEFDCFTITNKYINENKSKLCFVSFNILYATKVKKINSRSRTNCEQINKKNIVSFYI